MLLSLCQSLQQEVEVLDPQTNIKICDKWINYRRRLYMALDHPLLAFLLMVISLSYRFIYSHMALVDRAPQPRKVWCMAVRGIVCGLYDEVPKLEHTGCVNCVPFRRHFQCGRETIDITFACLVSSSIRAFKISWNLVKYSHVEQWEITRLPLRCNTPWAVL